MDALILIFGVPLGFIVGGVAGRWAQRRMWRLDLPYDERVKLLRQN